MVNLNDADYLLPVIHHDLDSILSDIRENHRSDMSTMSDQTPAEIMAGKLLNESGETAENGENEETENVGPDSFIQAVNTMFGELLKEKGVMEILGAVGKTPSIWSRAGGGKRN